MKELTHKQLLFKDKLLKQIGFIEKDPFLVSYLKLLEENLFKFKRVAQLSDFNIIDLLLKELEHKSNLAYQDGHQFNFITATDISNFIFCPASFAISKTFKVPKLEAAFAGIEMHENCGLLHFLTPYKIYNEFTDEEEVRHNSLDKLINSENRNFFDDIKNSTLVHSGHTDVYAKQYFTSRKGSYRGNPDYIFRRKYDNTYFAVEEKFHIIPREVSEYRRKHLTVQQEIEIEKKRTINHFFENHIHQLTSYMFGITEYDIQYGYLVYWKYYNVFDVVSCAVKKIEKTESVLKSLRNVYSSILEVIKKREGHFESSKRNPVKCANCAVNVLCCHKTGRFEKYTIPYSYDL